MAKMLEQGYIPVPDPTKLTTDAVALAKEEILGTLDIKLTGLRELFLEKFEGVKTDFHMRDIALAAAFKAAETAVQQQNASNTLAIDKSATAFTKQIDSLNEKIEDNKTRISEIAGRNWSTAIVGAVGIIAAVVAIIVSVMRLNGT